MEDYNLNDIDIEMLNDLFADNNIDQVIDMINNTKQLVVMEQVEKNQKSIKFIMDMISRLSERGIKSTEILITLNRVIKKQDKQINSLEKRIEELEKRLEAVK